MLPRLLRRLLWLWGFLGILVAVLSVATLFLPQAEGPTDSVPNGSAVIRLTDPSGSSMTHVVDLADTPEEHRRGLQNRPVVERPMVFVFSDDAPRSFWMKDTLVALDIFFFRSDGSWVSGHRMIPCLIDPCPTTPSGGSARYALEVPVGDSGVFVATGSVLTVLP